MLLKITNLILQIIENSEGNSSELAEPLRSFKIFKNFTQENLKAFECFNEFLENELEKKGVGEWIIEGKSLGELIIHEIKDRISLLGDFSGRRIRRQTVLSQ